VQPRRAKRDREQARRNPGVGCHDWLALRAIAMNCADLFLEHLDVIEHSLVCDREKVKDDQEPATGNEREQSQPSGVPLAGRKPDNKDCPDDTEQNQRDKGRPSWWC
jgi:hypothetical protein